MSENPEIVQVGNTYCVRKIQKPDRFIYSFLTEENEFSTIYKKTIFFKSELLAIQALEECIRKSRLEKIEKLQNNS
jgi:hypothetical protein